MNWKLRAAVAAGLVIAGGLQSGCLISGHSKDRTSGSFVGPTTFGQIEPGVTTERWVRAALGEPTSSSELEDGSTLMKWSYSRTRSSRSSVIFVFGGSSNREEVGATYVQVKDGVVTKAWRD